MNVQGPYKDKTKAASGASKPWYLSYFAPNLNVDGTVVLNEKGVPVLKRHRTYYETKAEAEADRPRIETQHTATGTSETLFDRNGIEDYEAAKKVLGDGVTMFSVAKFWRLHHPVEEEKRIVERVVEFIGVALYRLVRPNHINFGVQAMKGSASQQNPGQSHRKSVYTTRNIPGPYRAVSG